MENLKNIIRELIKIRKEEGLEHFEDNILFDAAVRIFNAQNIEHQKQYTPKYPTQKYTKESYGYDNKPTEKQINFLKKSGYDGDISILTKLEAKQLISEYIEKRNAQQ